MLIMVAAAAIAIFCLSGCKKSSSEAKPEPNAPAVKTMVEPTAEVKKDVGTELEKVKTELAKEPNVK